MFVWAEGNSGARARPCDHIVMGTGGTGASGGTGGGAGGTGGGAGHQ